MAAGHASESTHAVQVSDTLASGSPFLIKKPFLLSCGELETVFTKSKAGKNTVVVVNGQEKTT
ncbi:MULTISPECIES: hypothetical protein [Gammaproteobacteria]|nr:MULTISPECIES: hypothetical protein [Gammaproteobacteria]MBO9480043.1 hypothetical protein [Salinisphaera sp. G21_0]WBA83083.1 hypothetical protein O2T12_08195 [Endozoicomonas sp. GU-1]